MEEQQLNQMKRCRWWSYCCAITGAILVVLGAFMPLIMNGIITK